MPVQPTEAYYNGLHDIQAQNIDFENDDLRAMLLVDGHTKNLAASFVSAVVGDEHPASGNYARQVLAGKLTRLNVDQSEFDCDKIDFGANTTISARYLVIFKQVTNDADSPLLFIIDLSGGGNESSDNAEFSYTPSAQGLYIIDMNEVAA